jgi:hypothetical protein
MAERLRLERLADQLVAAVAKLDRQTSEPSFGEGAHRLGRYHASGWR